MFFVVHLHVDACLVAGDCQFFENIWENILQKFDVPSREFLTHGDGIWHTGKRVRREGDGFVLTNDGYCKKTHEIEIPQNVNPQDSVPQKKIIKSIVGKLGWVAILRPDVMYSHYLISSGTNFAWEKVIKANQVIKFLKKKSFKIKIPKLQGELQLITTTDVGDDRHGRPHQGILFFIGKRKNGKQHDFSEKLTPMQWFPKKRERFSTTTFEAETIALVSGLKKVEFYRIILCSLGILKSEEPTRVYCDNKSVVLNAKHEKQPQKSSTIAHFEYLREIIREKNIELYHIKGPRNPADALTKEKPNTAIYDIFSGEFNFGEDKK